MAADFDPYRKWLGIQPGARSTTIVCWGLIPRRLSPIRNRRQRSGSPVYFLVVADHGTDGYPSPPSESDARRLDLRRCGDRSDSSAPDRLGSEPSRP